MKTNYSQLLDKQVSLTATDATRHLMSAICESILGSEKGNSTDKNIFERPVTSSSSGDVSFSIGFASTGLRTGSILSSTEISNNLESITHAVRAHIPLVVSASVKSQFQVNQLSQTGAVVFSASTCQEALDFILISYQIAELSLIPVVICLDEAISQKEGSVLFPNKTILSHFAGNTDNLISSPTPSQQMIFGKSRKVIPNWFNLDNPVSIGAQKQAKESALEAAAQEEYFYNHLDAIIHESLKEFDSVTGRKYEDIELYNLKDAESLVISYGSISPVVVKAIEEAHSKNKIKVAAARLVQISPFPVKSFKKMLAGKKSLTILEQASSGINHSFIFQEVSSIPETKQLKIFSGNYGALPSPAAMVEVFTNMLQNGKGKTKFFIDIDFTRSTSGFPKHKVLMQAIEREYPHAQNKSLSSPLTSIGNQPGKGVVPMSIRKYKDQGPAYTKVSRFYDDTASFFYTNPEELIADPFQAIPIIPPATSNFNHPISKTEEKGLPTFYSANCTGCGNCFLHCPHSAINPLAVSIEGLIKAGMTISASNGVKITQLTPMVKNIAKNIHEEIKLRKGNINSVSDFIPAAFENVAVHMKLEGDKLQAARQDIEAVTNALLALPVSITDVFYNNPEILKNGSGELFSLAIDPNACTGCSICETVCNDEALKMTESNNDIIAAHQTEFALWELMPDTSAATITRLIDDRNFNSFAALLLSRYFNLALNGRSEDKDGNSSKAMVHLVTATAEAMIQPKVKEAIKTIDELSSALSQNIHNQLASALPTDDFDALAGVLSEIKDDRRPFEDVIEKLASGNRLKLLSTKILKRKVDLTKSLKTLKWLLQEGSSGNGRARMGISLDGSLKWSNSYPWNNFTSPVFIQVNGSAPELAMGMVQGHVRQMLDNIKIIRRAELEITGKYEPEINDIQIASLTWNDLTEKEKNFVPPIILIGNRDNLGGKDLNSLINMLDCNWPLKAIVFDDAVPEIDNAGAYIIGGIGSLLPALALQNAHVIKSSLANPEHLYTGLSEAFNSNKPALVWVFVPDASKHLTSSHTTPKLHALGLNTRAFPLFNFNPNREGMLLSSKIDMKGNTQSESLWMENNLSFKEKDEDKTIPYSLTWADWAYTLKSWRQEFVPYNESMGKAILVSEFIALSKSERTGKSPVIYRIDHNSELIKFQVSERVIAATEACVKAWQVLREISGELTEFPEKLHKKIEAELSDKYEKKMSMAKTEFESNLASLEQSHLEKTRVKLKEKLMQLSKPTNGK